MQKKFQVFVSSTYTDLVVERQEILKSILDMSHIPVGMEGFYATDQEQLTYIKKIIDECDYYLLIIAGRYGSLDEEGISYTEREYDYAVSRGITVLAFIHSDVASLPSSQVDSDKGMSRRLESFKNKVKQKRLVRFWKSKEELKSSVIISLSKTFAENPGLGWVRGNAAASDDILVQLNDVRREADQLRLENVELRSQLTPSVLNIASLAENFAVHYDFYLSEERGKRQNFHLMTWEAIFSVIAPAFVAPQSNYNSVIKVALESHIRNEQPKKYSSFFLRSEDVDTIKIQLEAHGLLKAYQAGTVGGGVAQFTELSEVGKRMLIEMRTVKSAILKISTQP